MQLRDKVALVVGASQGSGRAYVLALAREGARVVAAARTLSKPDVQDMVQRVSTRYGRIDVVVFAVGIHPRHELLAITSGEWDRVMRVNARGAYFVIRAVTPHMIAHGSGSIIVLTSTAATTTTHDGLLIYGISKAALNRLTTWFAEELRPHGIAVNAFSPGRTFTENMRRNFPEKYQEFVEAGAGNPPTPEVLGPPIVYLAQQSAATLTGQILHAGSFGSGWGPR